MIYFLKKSVQIIINAKQYAFIDLEFHPNSGIPYFKPINILNMKTITSTVLVLLLSATSFSVFAQNQKSIFREFPGSIEISKNTLKSTLVAKPGQTVSIRFNEKFVFTGKVMSNELKYSDLQSMIVKSDTYSNTLFQLSRITNNENSIKYIGRIINTDALEVFEIKNDVADNYQLQKIDGIYKGSAEKLLSRQSVRKTP